MTWTTSATTKIPDDPKVILDAPAEKIQQLRDLRRQVAAARAEKVRRRDVFTELGYTPTQRQQVFHDATEDDVLYGGAAGGGKSKALLMEGIRACVRYPGVRVGAFRRTFPELEESLLAELAKVEYARAVGARYNRSAHDLAFPNGSLFMFRYARNLPDATVRQGGQYQLLIVDELALMDPEVVAFLQSRMRSGDAGIPVLGFRAGSNPGGAGHGAVRQKYITGPTTCPRCQQDMAGAHALCPHCGQPASTDHGAQVYLDDGGQTVRFVPAKVDDNPHLDAGYHQRLNRLPEQMRAAFRDGSWDSFEGQAFPEWRHDRIVVAPFEIPEEWITYGGMDYGWSAPSVYLEASQDRDGRLWVHRELVMRQTPELDQARRILAASRARVRFADPAMWGKTGSALPPATQMATVGLALRKGDNDRLGGKARMHTYLSEGPACPIHHALGWSTCPMLHVLDGTAPEFTRTMPDLPVDPLKPEDVDTTANDHAYDAARYLVTGVGATVSLVTDETPERPPIVPVEDQVRLGAHGYGWDTEGAGPGGVGGVQRAPWLGGPVQAPTDPNGPGPYGDI